MQTAVNRAIRIGKTTALAIGVGVTLALVLGVATVALAAVPGDPLRLGQINSINALTQLVGSVNGPLMMIDNNSTGSGAHALQILVEPGKAPMKVNSGAKVANLNADRLDGKDGSAFFSGKTYETSSSGVFTGGGGTLARAVPPNCDSGDKMIGGGGIGGNEDDLVGSEPVNNVQWAITVRDNGPKSIITAKGVCADFPPLRQ